MKTHDPLTTAAVLDLLGLQSKPTYTQRFITYAAFAATGILVGAAAGVLFAPKSGRLMRADLRGGVKGVGDQIVAGAARARDAVTSDRTARGNNAEIVGVG